MNMLEDCFSSNVQIYKKIYFERVLKDFVSKFVVTQNIFLLSLRNFDQELIIFMVYFQIWNKKERKIIISRDISGHMGPIDIETPYMNMLEGFVFPQM